MTNDRTLLDRAAAHLMDLESPVYGDERERGLVMEAYTFGATATVYVCIGAAVVGAVLGGLALPVALLVASTLPSAASIWYARRRGIDLLALSERATPRTRRTAVVTVAGGTLLVLSAMLFTVQAGHGLVTVPEPSPQGARVLDTLVLGAIVGAMIGGLAGVIAQLAHRKSSRAESSDLDDTDD